MSEEVKDYYYGLKGWEALGFKTYTEYLESVLWEEKKKIIFQEKGRKCERCGSDKSLVVHHKTYKNVCNERMEDVEVLCWNCHHKEHKLDEEVKNDI